MEFMRKHKGVITIMLVILLLPMLTCGSVLMELGRYRSIKALLEEISSNALLSSLAGFDSSLYEKYGIYGVKDEQDEVVSGYITQNLNANDGTFSRILTEGNVSVLVDEFSPLSSVSVLKSQLVEYEKLRAPTNAAVNMLNIDEILKNFKESLESLIPGLDIIKNAINKLSAYAKVAKSCEKAYNAQKEWNEKSGAYYSSISSLVSAMNNLWNFYNEHGAGGTEAMELEDDEQDEYDNLVRAVNNAQRSASNAVKDIKRAGDSYVDAIDGLLKSCQELAGTIANVGVSNDYRHKTQYLEKRYNDMLTKETIDGIKETYREQEKKEQELNDAITELSTNTSGFVADTVKRNFDNKVNDVQKGVDKVAAKSGYANNSFFDSYRDSNGDTVYTLNAKPSGSSHVTARLGSANYTIYYSDLFSMNLADLVRSILENSFISLDGMLGYIKVFLNVILNVQSAAKDHNVNLNAVVNVTAWTNDSYSNAEDMAALSTALDNASAVAASLGYDISALDPQSRTTDADAFASVEEYISNVTEGAVKVINAICGLVELVVEITTEGKWWKIFTGGIPDKIGDLLDGFTSIYNGVKGLLHSNLSNILTALVHEVYEGALLNTYVTEKFTSRKDLKITEGANSVQDLLEILKNETLGSLAPRDTSGKKFKGAEIEYVCLGNAKEIENQKYVHRFIFLVRMVDNLVACLLSPEVGDVAAAANVFAPLVYLLWAGAESYLDVGVLQGMDKAMPLMKTQLILSTDGLADMLEQAGKEGKNWKISFSPSVNMTALWSSLGNILSRSGEGIFKLDYNGYCWFLLCLQSSATKTKRIANLIQMNMQADDASFDLNEYNTYLRCKVNYDYETVMPFIGNFASLGGVLSNDVVRYAGY